MTDVVTVRCAGHHAKLASGLYKFYESLSGVDFEFQTLKDGERSVHAHQLVLSVFLSTEKLTEHADQLTSDEVDALLKFVYKGTATIRKEHVKSLLQFARSSDFQLLADTLESLNENEADETPPTIKEDHREVLPKRRCSVKKKVSVSEKVVADDDDDDDESSSTVRTIGEPVPGRSDEPDRFMEEESGDDVVRSRRSSTAPAKPSRVKKEKCSLCSATFATPKTLRHHIATIHQMASEKQHKCKFCDKTFTRLVYAQRHALSHANNSPYLQALRTEQQQPEPGEKKSFLCPICGNSFVTRYILMIHTRRKHTTERPFQCDQCGRTFTSSSDCNRHVKTHSNERPFMCQICGASFSRDYILTRHMQTHSGLKLHSCNECGKHFTQRSSLTVHKRMHTGEKPFKCDVEGCGASFAYRQSLIDHSGTHINTDEKYLQCNTCRKTFSTSYALKEHKRTHAGERPFKCHVCSKDFGSKMELSVHVMIHTGEKPHVCPVEGCGKSFIQRAKLKLHSLTHGGEKPFRCHCGKTFSTRQNFSRHSSTHDKELAYGGVSPI